MSIKNIYIFVSLSTNIFDKISAIEANKKFIKIGAECYIVHKSYVIKGCYLAGNYPFMYSLSIIFHKKKETLLLKSNYYTPKNHNNYK